MRVHLHVLLFIEYPFNKNTFFVECNGLWEYGNSVAVSLTSPEPKKSRKIRALIEEAERQSSGRMPASEKACFDELKGVGQTSAARSIQALLCEAVYSPAGRGRRISALTVSIAGRMIASDWDTAAYGAGFNPVTQTIAVDHPAVTWCA
ncbi:hypothetical protein [Mesorhizobium argentiipisi]|uniref:Uncharacterized protein n=1 Tax=Mesorhizobium argentiipisi TaxID=3015175 RepID=A0ABU8KFJ8_9HYPH